MRGRTIVYGGLLLGALALAVNAAPVIEKDDEKLHSVFARAVASARKNDFETLLGCLTADSQRFVVGRMVKDAVELRSFADLYAADRAPEVKKLLDDLFVRHGLPSKELEKLAPGKNPRDIEKHLRSVADLVKDKAGFCRAVMAVTERSSGKKTYPSLGDAKLIEVKINGNKASGTVVIEGAKKKGSIDFVKVEGRWKLSIEPKSRPAGSSSRKPGKMPE